MAVRLQYQSRVFVAAPLGDRNHGLASIEQHAREVMSQS